MTFSVLSATNVMRALDPARYDAVPIFVTREGRWLLSAYADATLSTPAAGTEVCLVPGGGGRILAIPPDGATAELPGIDILFPVLHGLHGEDGAVQGLAEVARVPLAGCGILGSAVALDKDIAKRLLAAAGLPVARALTLHEGSVPPMAALEKDIGFPLSSSRRAKGHPSGSARSQVRRTSHRPWPRASGMTASCSPSASSKGGRSSSRRWKTQTAPSSYRGPGRSRRPRTTPSTATTRNTSTRAGRR